MILTRDGSFYRTLTRLAIPIALQNLLTFMVGFVDNVMVGRLGDTAISGVYMGNKVMVVFQLFMLGIEGALLVLSSQYWGKKDSASIKKLVAIAARLGLLIAIAFTTLSVLFPNAIISVFTPEPKVIEAGADYLRIVAFSYLFYSITHILINSMRSVENARIGFFVSLTTLFVDIGLNYLFIFGVEGFIPAMGIVGAAIATLCARILEAIIMLLFVRFKDQKLRLRLTDLKLFDKAITGDFLKFGLPIVGGNIVWAINGIANGMILGRISPEVITAASMTDTLNNLAYVWISGLAGAVGIITAKTVGSGRLEKIKEYSRTVQIIFLALGLLTGLALFFLRLPFIELYDASPEAKEVAAQLTVVLSVTLVGTCYQAACLAGLVKSGGDVSFVLKNDTIFVFLVVIPSALVAWQLGAPAWAVFAALKCDQILKCFVAVVKINSYNWVKNLTRESTDAG